MKKTWTFLVLLVFISLVLAQDSDIINAINQMRIDWKVDMANLQAQLAMQQNQTRTDNLETKAELKKYIDSSIINATAHSDATIKQETLPLKFAMGTIFSSLTIIAFSRWLNARKKY